MNLCTFAGKTGDILWALPTVRELAAAAGGVIDMAVMPQYAGLLELLEVQPYIRKAFVIHEWQCTGSPHGDQPWESPWFEGRDEYGRVLDLTYRTHPHGMPLSVWTAIQAGVQLPESYVPFITAPERPGTEGLLAAGKFVTCAFNEMYKPQKDAFLEELRQELASGTSVVNVAVVDWATAAKLIKHSLGFVGCRSANYVLAHGLGQRVLCFEPCLARSASFMGGVFGPPRGVGETVVVSAVQAAEVVWQWLREDKQEEEKTDAIAIS